MTKIGRDPFSPVYCTRNLSAIYFTPQSGRSGNRTAITEGRIRRDGRRTEHDTTATTTTGSLTTYLESLCDLFFCFSSNMVS